MLPIRVMATVERRQGSLIWPDLPVVIGGCLMAKSNQTMLAKAAKSQFPPGAQVSKSDGLDRHKC